MTPGGNNFSRTKVIFQNYPGPGILKKIIQDFPGGVGTLVKTAECKNNTNLIGKKTHTSNRQIIFMLTTKLYAWSSIATYTVKINMLALGM